ncbi:MAG: hypothetical protein JWP11_2796 [Frankiales bacterium]|jgi:hypothetical protein|nr:hypothetical protein [Frankiales bacterium]
MNAGRRRAVATALAAAVVALLCAALSLNVDGGHRTLLILLTAAWLVIAAVPAARALRTSGAQPPVIAAETGAGDEPT